MISTLIAELQLFCRFGSALAALAIYLVTFTGSMTVGALIWGLVAEGVGLQLTFFTAAVVMPGESSLASGVCQRPATRQ